LILTLVAIVVVVLLLAFTVAAVVVLGVSGVAFSRQQRERGQRDPTQRLQRIATGRGIRVRANERVKAPVIHAFRPSERRRAAVVLPHRGYHHAASWCRKSSLRAPCGESLSTS
jgi:hypothetical protein